MINYELMTYKYDEKYCGLFKANFNIKKKYFLFFYLSENIILTSYYNIFMLLLYRYDWFEFCFTEVEHTTHFKVIDKLYILFLNLYFLASKYPRAFIAAFICSWSWIINIVNFYYTIYIFIFILIFLC